MIFSNKPDKEVLDSFAEKSLIHLYTGIAGITSGYISIVQRDFHISKGEAEKWILEVDKRARDKVSEAYHFYDSEKDKKRDD